LKRAAQRYECGTSRDVPWWSTPRPERESDHSIEAANKIENLLLRRFSRVEFQEDLVEDLARYRPGGGEYLLDETRMLEKLRLLRVELEKLT
jgi:hypothetical protein